jgi:hypothetical protein
VLLYTGFVFVILDAAGLISILAERLCMILIWAIAGYFLLGAGVNLISPSLPERMTMTPLAVCLFVLTVLVAKGRSRNMAKGYHREVQ